MKGTIIKASATIITFICLFFASCITEYEESEVVNYVNTGDRIPPFKVMNENDEVFDSSSFIGKKSLLMFFHTGCSDCRRELPIIDEAYRMLNDSIYCFVAIAREEPKEDVLKYWKENNLTIPTYFDNDRYVYSLFTNSYIPRIYLINEEGKVTYMGIETFNLTSEELAEKIKNQ